MANRIKELREAMGEKQLDLAKILNVSQGTLSNWERGVHDPDNSILLKLADHFNVSVDFLLKNTYDSKIVKEKAPTLESEMELLRDYMLRKLGREPTPEELARLDSFNETYIKGLNK